MISLISWWFVDNEWTWSIAVLSTIYKIKFLDSKYIYWIQSGRLKGKGGIET